MSERVARLTTETARRAERAGRKAAEAEVQVLREQLEACTKAKVKFLEDYEAMESRAEAAEEIIRRLKGGDARVVDS